VPMNSYSKRRSRLRALFEEMRGTGRSATLRAHPVSVSPDSVVKTMPVWPRIVKLPSVCSAAFLASLVGRRWEWLWESLVRSTRVENLRPPTISFVHDVRILEFLHERLLPLIGGIAHLKYLFTRKQVPKKSSAIYSKKNLLLTIFHRGAYSQNSRDLRR